MKLPIVIGAKNSEHLMVDWLVSQKTNHVRIYHKEMGTNYQTLDMTTQMFKRMCHVAENDIETMPVLDHMEYHSEED